MVTSDRLNFPSVENLHELDVTSSSDLTEEFFLSNHWLLIKKIHLTELVMHHFIQSTAIGTTRGIFQFFYNTTHKTLLNAAVVWSTFFVFSIFQAETKNGKWHLDEYVWLENTEIPQHLAIINCGQCAVFRSKGNCIHSKKT